MIGNDIVDLKLASVESNWRRSNFITKIFTVSEQNFIARSKNPELEVWKLWSRKEAAYKIYNRETGMRGYFPWKLECSNAEKSFGKEVGLVGIGNQLYHTETYISQEFIYTIAVTTVKMFHKIIAVNQDEQIIKINGLPFLERELKPVSITHHGRFERKITLLDT